MPEFARAPSARLDETARHTRSLAERMREVVWTVNPRCDNLPSLAAFLEQQMDILIRASGVKARLEFPEDIPALPLKTEARHQLALAVREALTNVVRHAHATEVLMSLTIADGMLVVRVADNGCGFRMDHINSTSQGLSNMRTRMEHAGGTFKCDSSPSHGTSVIFQLSVSSSENTKLFS